MTKIFTCEFTGNQCPLLDITEPAGLELFDNDFSLHEFDLYWIVYEAGPLKRQARKELKAAGWRLQRHSRSNREMWIFDKVDWAKKVELDSVKGK